MKKSDFGVVGVIYAVALFFLFMTLELPEEAQTYPLGLICALAGLNTLYLLQSLVKYLATRKIENDLPKIFEGFQARQFAVVCFGCIAFLFLVQLVGYYAASGIYLVAMLLFFRVPKWQIALAFIILVALVYAVFTLFLKVPLPVGMLFA